MERGAQEAKMIELNKPALIKVVKEVANEDGVDPNALRNKKGSQEFLKQQDDEFNKNDQRNFKVHNPFKFGYFGITEWDELSVIIPKTKNKVVGDIMTSLSKKYKRLNQILGELGISPSLPPPKQVPLLSSGIKRKVLELEPEVCINGLECNKSLSEGIPFVNNKVIENPKHWIFFTDPFEVQAFQREARLVTLSKAEMIKVVKEVASEAGVDPKALRGSMDSQEFLKKQDAEFNVLQKEHLENRKKS
nr:hypothetical protein [Tanacetum cinerariifolium]